MTITFKQEGEVIYSKSGETTVAFSSIKTVGGDLVAEDYGLAGFYAAAVTGFEAGYYTVEITPYVILMGGTRITGETTSADIAFLF
jgi:hypothetical protein